MAGGLQITHVPYKGTAPALADLVGGQVDMMFDNLGVSLPHVRRDRLKALAVASRAALVRRCPTCPTLAETLPGFESVAWFGIVAPPKTPAAMAEKVAAGVREALKASRRAASGCSELSAEPMGLGPAETAALHEAGNRALGRRDPRRQGQAGVIQGSDYTVSESATSPLRDPWRARKINGLPLARQMAGPLPATFRRHHAFPNPVMHKQFP